MNFLKYFVDSIKMTFRFYNTEGDGGGSPTDTDLLIGDEKGELFDTSGASDSIERYIGGEDVNPNQRPLKDFNRDGMTKKDIDNFIRESGGEVFLTDEEIEVRKADEEKAKKAKKNDSEKGDKTENKKGKEDTDSGEDKSKEGKGKEGDKKSDKSDSSDSDADDAEVNEMVEKFWEVTGLSQEEFDSLPEKTQQMLHDKVFPDAEADLSENETHKKLLNEHNELKKSMADITGDAVIKARLEEKKSGKKLVASADDIVTKDLIDKFDEMAINKDLDGAKNLLKDAVKKAIDLERTVADEEAAFKNDRQSVWSIVRKLGKIDKRFEIKEKNYEDFISQGEKHDEWGKFTEKDGLHDVLKYLKDKEYTLKQLKKFEPEEIYTLYAKSRGWDSKRDKEIHKQGVKSVLDKLRNPKRVAGTLKDQGKKPVVPGGKLFSGGIDADSLVKGLAEGDPEAEKRFIKLRDAFEGDVAKVTQLSAIMSRANELKDSERKKSRKK